MKETFRKDKRVPVDIGCVIRPGQEEVPGRLVDLGLGGLSALLDRNIGPSKSVEVEFSLPPVDTTICLQATVQWSRVQEEGGWTVGLAFVDPPGSALVEIADWIARIPRTRDIE